MTKKYKVLFFTTTIGAAGNHLRDALPAMIAGLATPAQLPDRSIEGSAFQIRDLIRIGQSRVWQGTFGRLRDDAPNLVDVNGQESAIPLQPTDRLLEKCHFLYFADRDILVWQVNNEVAYVSKFTLYLGELLNTFVAANTIVGTDALNRVMQGTVKNIECKVASPRTPISRTPNYSQPMFDLMNGVNGSTIKVNISAGRGTLSGNVMRLINWAVANPDTKTLRAKIDGESEPIDLLVDRVSDSIYVELVGHYPVPADVFAGLLDAFTNNSDELAPYFR